MRIRNILALIVAAHAAADDEKRLLCGQQAWFCNECPPSSHKIQYRTTGPSPRTLNDPDCADSEVRKAFEMCKNCAGRLSRCKGVCPVCTARKEGSVGNKTLLLPVLSQPRTGSSMVASFIGESPEVLELQEMFNQEAPFAHSPHAHEAERFMRKKLLGDAPSAPWPVVAANMSSDYAGTLKLAAEMAQMKHRPVVSWKIFGCQASLATMFSGYETGSTAVLLSRNMFTSAVSFEKIASGCSYWQGKDSTRCSATLNTTKLELALVNRLISECCHMGMAGVAPFQKLDGIPHVSLNYEYLERLPSMEAKFDVVASRVRTASDGALCGYATNKNTANAYSQQDQNHSLLSSLNNFEQLRAWYTPERRHQICQTSMDQCLREGSTYGYLGATLESLVRWCTSSRVADLELG